MDDIKVIARNISLIENAVDGYEKLLLQNEHSSLKTSAIIGVTGAPGAGKSTLTDKLIGKIIEQNKTVAVLCIDPSSPFNMGALLGDRIRMNKWYAHEKVFIRSFASRKSLGGISPMMIEITEYLKHQDFDFIIIETVGVGQSEIEIAGLADITVVVLVPEGGDEIQMMKSGVMEIADILVVNKSDRPGADIFYKNLLYQLSPTNKKINILKTVAEENTGINELFEAINAQLKLYVVSEKKYWLLAEKIYKIISAKRMKNLNVQNIFTDVKKEFVEEKNFNFYSFLQKYSAE